MTLTYGQKIQLLQLMCFIGGPLVIIFNFNLSYLLISFVASNIIVNTGIGLTYHRMYAHKSWNPKLKIIEHIFYFLGIICAMGPAINWCGTHRLHHATSDTNRDPHSPVKKTLITKIKYWFNYWEVHNVEIKYIKDLLKDKKHKFVYKNYFKIIFIYITVLYLINIDLFLYGFLVTTMFSLHFVSWITVGAHIFGTRDQHTKDRSLNTNIMGLFLWGEGYHNNHHWKPSSPNFGFDKFDLGYKIICLLR